MPTSLGHALAGYAMGTAAAPDDANRRFLVTCAFAGVLPDLDVALALLPGSAYASLGGHRGITHSLAFAGALALLVVAVRYRAGARSPTREWLALASALASHPLLDMLTSYGNGVALFAPFSWIFVRFPWHPIDPDTAARGATTTLGQLSFAVGNEVLWVWLPALALVAAMRRLRRHHPPPQGTPTA